MQRIAIIVGSLLALAIGTAPAPGKSPTAQKADEKTAPASCHSYVQNPDGSWVPIPCQEIGPPTQAQHKPPPRGEDDDTH